MGVRFRRNIKLVPGVRLNVTKTGIGVTTGGRYARYSVHSSGRRTVGLGLPGTGTYYQKSVGGRSGVGTSAHAESVDVRQLIRKPGLLASGADRAYHAGLVAYFGDDQAAALASFEQALAAD